MARTEPASPRKLQRARALGDYPQSPLLKIAVIAAAITCLLPSLARSLANHLQHELSALAQASTSAVALNQAWSSALQQLVRSASPVLVVALVAPLALDLAQSGGAWLRAPTLARPRGGLARLWDLQTIVRSALRILWAALIVLACTQWLASHAPDLAHCMGRAKRGRDLAEATTVHLLWITAGVALLVGAADWLLAWQFWRRRQRMSPDEKKREHRELEGDPTVQAHREQARQEALLDTAEQSLPQANLVVYSEGELAVLIRYVPSEAPVPRIINIAVSALARRIVQAAQAAHIPLYRDDALAASLAQLQPGRSIAEHQYVAVAEALAHGQ